jgi:TANFOR domain-containing protein
MNNYNLNKMKIHAYLKFLFVLFILRLGITLQAQNQVVVNVVVPPPYSPDISYYTDNPGRLMVNLVNKTSQNQEIYLRGSFLDADGIGVKTGSNYKPSSPISIEAMGSYHLTLDELGEIFSTNDLQFIGVDMNEIIQNQGLPEGMYRICMQAFDFATDQALSQAGSGCSNYFPIQYVEPPTIITPVCGDSLIAYDPQNVVINWTVPQGVNSMNIVYHLRMVEMFPSERDPNDALQSAGHPDFLEATTNVNTYIITASDPELMAGRNYAFEVRAEDEDGNLLFLNNGVSEACWFKYKEGVVNPDVTPGGGLSVEMEDFLNEFEFIPNTTVSGRLLAKLHEDGQTIVSTGAVSLDGSQSAPSGGGENSSGGGNTSANGTNQGGQGNLNGGYYQSFVNSGLRNAGNLNINNISFTGGYFSQGLTFLPPVGKGLVNPHTVDVNGAVPLKNVAVRLVLRPVLKEGNGFYTAGYDDLFESSNDVNARNILFRDIKGESISKDVYESMKNQVVATSYTDENGNFSFDFQGNFFTGPVYNSDQLYGGFALKIEVERAEFCSPDVDIYVEPGDHIELGDEVVLFNTYDAEISVLTNPNIKGAAIEENKPVPGSIVGIFRKQSEIDEIPDIVVNHEGFRKSKYVENIHGKFLEIFSGQVGNDGKVVIPNLMYHRKAKPDGYYYINARTRSEDPGHEEENTLYNYEEEWRYVNLLTEGITVFGTRTYEDNTVDLSKPMLNNHQHTQLTYNTTCVLSPGPPEIKGRVMAQSNLENVALKNAKVELFDVPLPGKDIIYSTFGQAQGLELDEYMRTWIPEYTNCGIEEMQNVNSSGYFRFVGLNVTKDEYGAVKGPYRRVLITAEGYKPVVFPPLEDNALNIKDGELIDIHDIQMEPAQMLLGKVIDEEGNAIPAYVRMLPEGPYFKTETHQAYNMITGQPGEIYEYFEMASPKQNIHLEIMPLSNQYFPLDTIIPALPQDPYERITCKVFKKMHRLHLLVENNTTNAGIPNATVIVGDTMAYKVTGDDAVAELVFPSPGEQFLVKVFAEGYSPTQQSFTVPISRDWTNKIIFMKPAHTIHGYVKEQASGQAVAGATVYIQMESSDGHTVYIESQTGPDGQYTLAGVPTGIPTIEIHAVKNGNTPSYIGSSKTFTIEPFAIPAKSYDLTIKKAQGWDFSDIWGIPVTIEGMVSKPGKGTFVSGYFHDLPSSPVFSTLNEDEKLYFSSIRIEKGNDQKINPKNDWIYTDSYSIPIKIKGGFEGDFRKSYQQKIIVKKKGEFAEISAPLKLDLASFKFAYDFAGELYMEDDTISDGTDIEVFRSVADGSSGGFYLGRYNIVDESNDPISDFRVFGFDASSDYQGSYYENGKINLQTYLQTHIPLDGTGRTINLNINAGKIEISKEDMNMIPNANSLLSFDLEKWKVQSTQGWNFDKTKDAIVIPKATIFTGSGVDADIQGLTIRPNSLREGEIDMTGDGLSLGGIVPLEINQSVEPMFNYDAGVGHYRISMVGNTNGQAAAMVSNLPAMNKTLEFKSIGMLSDGSNVLNIYQKAKFYNILDLDISQIMTGPGFFQLAGTPHLGIPGFIPTRAIMTYKKQNGSLTAEIEPLSGAIDCNRNVEFTLDQNQLAQHIEPNRYTCYGNIYVKPSLNEGGEKFSLRGFLEKTPNDVHIEVIKVDDQGKYKGVNRQKFYTGEHYMNVFEGNLAVQNNQWQELWYKANTNSQGLSEDNVGTFVVHGGIDYDSEQIEVDDIEIPGLGKLKMVYLFDDMALVGTLIITERLEMGFASVNSGNMESRFDPSGFYFALAANITYNAQDYDGGFIMGVYSKDLNPVSARFLQNYDDNPPDFSRGMHGFYVIAQRPLINKSFWIPLSPPIEVAIKASAGVFVYFDYQHPEFTLGGYAYAYGKGGYYFPPPLDCYAGADGEAFARLKGGYKKNLGIYFDACGMVKVKVDACGLKGKIGVMQKLQLASGANSKVQAELKLNGTCPSHQ